MLYTRIARGLRVFYLFESLHRFATALSEMFATLSWIFGRLALCRSRDTAQLFLIGIERPKTHDPLHKTEQFGGVLTFIVYLVAVLLTSGPQYPR